MLKPIPGNFYRQLAGLILATLTTAAVQAEEPVLTIEGALIRGDQESPTVLYLVPWQPPVAQSLPRPEASFMVERATAPLERPQFQRLLGYHARFRALNEAEAGPDTGPGE